MADILRIAALALTGVLCVVVVKRSLPELGLLLALVVTALLLYVALNAADEIAALFRELGALTGLSSDILAAVAKTVGIGIITRIAADFCRDAKEGGIATAVELGGTVAALFAALPLLRLVLRTLTTLL